MPDAAPVIALTPGEPAGIGAEIAVKAAHRAVPARLVAIADPALLERAAARLGLRTRLVDADHGSRHARGVLRVIPVRLAAPVTPGRPDPRNAACVIEALERAVAGCLDGAFDAMVTGPVQKSAVNAAGIPFRGHTEYLAERCAAARAVMMLAADDLRVALHTTHLPLRSVPRALDADDLERVVRVVHGDLERLFGIDSPRVSVCGLNPHAGEDGHLGREELEIIGPTLERLRGDGLAVTGPLPADTAFTRDALRRVDAVLAMYHDQGLPVIKHLGFGRVVNVTLGLPIVRTSVDHGTALDLAGTGKARADSLLRAIEVAARFARRLSGAPRRAAARVPSS